MSAQAGALAAAHSDVVIGAVVDAGGGIFRFPISPNVFSPLSIRGIAIEVMQSIGGGGLNFRVLIQAVVSQSYISRVIVQSSAGTHTLLLTSDATFTNPLGTKSRWDWSGSGVWTTTHASRTVQVIY